MIIRDDRNQEVLSSLFGNGGKIWGVENEPVKMNGILMRGGGLIKGSERISDKDPYGETSSFFGL